MHFCCEQNLISVDVANATNDLLVQQNFLDLFVLLLHSLRQIILSKCGLIIDLRPQFADGRMLQFLSLLHQMHSTKLPHIIVHNTIPIREDKLYMVMLLLLVFLIIPDVLSFHPQVRDHRPVIELQDEVLAVAIDVGESLANERVYEEGGLDLLDDVGVVSFDGFYLFGFGFQADILEESTHCLDLRQFGHIRIQSEYPAISQPFIRRKNIKRSSFLTSSQLIIICVDYNMSGKQTLNSEEKQIMRQVNDLLFPTFKQFKLAYYNSLMKCSINVNNTDRYYQCTDRIMQKQAQAAQAMKKQLQEYQTQYKSKITQCRPSDKQCLDSCHEDLRQNIFTIFNTFYQTTFL